MKSTSVFTHIEYQKRYHLDIILD